MISWLFTSSIFWVFQVHTRYNAVQQLAGSHSAQYGLFSVNQGKFHFGISQAYRVTMSAMRLASAWPTSGIFAWPVFYGRFMDSNGSAR